MLKFVLVDNYFFSLRFKFGIERFSHLVYDVFLEKYKTVFNNKKTAFNNKICQ